MQDHDFAFSIAENENIAVAKMRFLDGLFEGHRAHGDGFVGADDVHFGSCGDGGLAMHDY